MLCGNANELGDISGSSGKGFLFFLTDYHLGIGLSGDKVQYLVKQPTFWLSGALPMIREKPGESFSF